jgi:hypothetical protein
MVQVEICFWFVSFLGHLLNWWLVLQLSCSQASNTTWDVAISLRVNIHQVSSWWHRFPWYPISSNPNKYSQYLFPIYSNDIPLLS